MDFKLIEKAIHRGPSGLTKEEVTSVTDFLDGLETSDPDKAAVLTKALDSGVLALDSKEYNNIMSMRNDEQFGMESSLKDMLNNPPTETRNLEQERSITSIQEGKDTRATEAAQAAAEEQEWLNSEDDESYPIQQAQPKSDYDRLLQLGKDYGAKAMNTFFK